MKKLLVLLPLVCLLAPVGLVWQACSDEKTCATQPLNPNGDSELALLMRAIFEDGMRVRDQILKGETPDIQVDFEKILTAKATDPEKMQTADFEPLAMSYVQAMQALKAAKPEEAEQLFTTMATTCMNCHHNICPGPTVRIKKLFLESN